MASDSVGARAGWDMLDAIAKVAGGHDAQAEWTATFVRTDPDGTPWVRLPGANDDTPVNGHMLADAEPGQSVRCRVEGGRLSVIGNASAPATSAAHVDEVVAPVVESAIAAMAEASQAKASATSAEQVANATAQHVWTDTNGLHVTEVEQDEWSDSEGASYHSGMNVLINSLGQLFRDGLTNLLAIVSGTTPSIAIYDGQSNADSNIVAKFAADLIELGKNNPQAVIELCGGLGRIGYNSSYASTLTIDAGTRDVLITGWNALMQNGNGELVGAASDGAYVRSDNVTIMDLPEDISESYPIASVVNAIPVTLYDNASASASASATLSETAANFKRLTIFYRDTDNNYSSVDVWSPNGKRVVLDLTWINGASTQDMYQRVRWVTISGKTISTFKGSSDSKYRTGQVKLGATASVTNADYIAITHVIGYR